MLLSKKYAYYEKIVSDSCSLEDVKKIIQLHPQILTFSSCHAIPLDRLCMGKTSNPDIIIYLVQESIKQNSSNNNNKTTNDDDGSRKKNSKSSSNKHHHHDDSSDRGGLLRDRGLCMPPLKMLIYNDRIDVLKRLRQINMILPEDIIKFQFLHFAVSHCRLEWVRFFLELSPASVCVKDRFGLLPIHLCANEWHKDPNTFWEIFRLLLEEGVRQGVGGGDEGVGGLFVQMPNCQKNLIDEIFKSQGMSWEKISRVVKDGNVRRVLVHQLAKGNISKRHVNDIIKHFPDCVCVKYQGRLPIHVAAESGLAWDDGMKTIVEANLSAIETVDEVTNLLPFGLAAAGRDKDLQSIYELLRHFPNCCSIQIVKKF